ncbi:MAG TPA: hypothetical protein VNW95_16365 [Mucilaginibacter sp.]|jgi:hypothetical protein|nr:hypothetical protein [Mucilaginibacter sp.]
MAKIIDPAVAKTLIQDYKNRNTTAGGPGLKTPDGKDLNGFFIDRACLEAIFKKDPKCVGISVNFGKHARFEAAGDTVVTLVFAGVVPATSGTTPYQTTGDIYSDPPPCPTFCSNLGA